MLALALLLAGPETAIDAERAFNAAAQAKGQWTAFREFMTDDAIVFTPQPTKAKEALPDKNPPIAVQWWPARSFVSCDGSVAVNTGSWVRPKSFGYFTTVWQRQPDGHYKWALDHGDALSTPRALPEKPRVMRASCGPVRTFVNTEMTLMDSAEKTGGGRSPDGTLIWGWVVDSKGARAFNVLLWNGRRFAEVLTDKVAADK